MHVQVIHSQFSTPILKKIQAQCEDTCSCETIRIRLDGESLLSQFSQLKSGVIWGCWITVYDLNEIDEFVTLLLGAIYEKKPEKVVIALPQTQGKSWIHYHLTSLIARLQQANCPIIILEFPRLFSEILLNQQLLDKEQVLMLPMGGAVMSWIAPQELSRQFTYHLIYSQVSMTVRLAEHVFLGGRTIANSFNEWLSHPTGEDAWAIKRMKSIDLNEDERLDREELTHYFKQLGWGKQEIQVWLSLTLGNSPYIEIKEVVGSVQSLLSTDESDPSSSYIYLNIPPTYAFQEWEEKEDIQEISLLKAIDYWEGNRTYSKAQEDSFSLKELDRWLEAEYPRSQKIHLLPGLGVLKTLSTDSRFEDLTVQEFSLNSGAFLHRSLDAEKNLLSYEKIGQENDPELLREWIHYEEDMRSIALVEGSPVYLCAEPAWGGWEQALDLLINQKPITSPQIQQFRSKGDLSISFQLTDKQHPFSTHDGKTYYFAGGLGIAAAMAMIRSRGNRRNPQPLQLEWAVKDRASLVFEDELTYWASRMSVFTWSYTLTEAEGPIRSMGIQHKFPFTQEGVAYICGSPAYVSLIYRGLKDAGWPDNRIRRELFDTLPHPEISQHIGLPALADEKFTPLSINALS